MSWKDWELGGRSNAGNAWRQEACAPQQRYWGRGTEAEVLKQRYWSRGPTCTSTNKQIQVVGHKSGGKQPEHRWQYIFNVALSELGLPRHPCTELAYFLFLHKEWLILVVGCCLPPFSDLGPAAILVEQLAHLSLSRSPFLPLPRMWNTFCRPGIFTREFVGETGDSGGNCRGGVMRGSRLSRPLTSNASHLFYSHKQRLSPKRVGCRDWMSVR